MSPAEYLMNHEQLNTDDLATEDLDSVWLADLLADGVIPQDGFDRAMQRLVDCWEAL